MIRLTFVGAAMAATLLLCLAGCDTLYQTPKVDVAAITYVAPPVIPVPAISNGSIFQSAQYRPLFEDYRARLVGDSITVQIVEKISATQKSTSSIDKNGKVAAAITALPLLSLNSFNRASAAGSSDTSFSGAGTVANSNDFSGTITAVVTAVLANGSLLIAGEKQIGVNQNVDVLRFSGQVDPRMIQSGNVVASAQIANVRIEQRGRGAQADAQGIGWLSRFFLNVLPI
ncbi:MAG: flagellar basal body L-ring protein FlgH [Pseudomonadota bacterium]|nr:flagellar basal body L-ring protein FlgH [Pseudomonadota bacterium]